MLGTKDAPLKGTAKVLFAKTTKVGDGYKTFLVLLDGLPSGKTADGKTKYRNSRIPVEYWSDADPMVKAGDKVEVEFRIIENDYFVQVKVARETLKTNPAKAVEDVKAALKTAHGLLTAVPDPSAKWGPKEPETPLQLKAFSLRVVEQGGAAKPVAAAAAATPAPAAGGSPFD